MFHYYPERCSVCQGGVVNKKAEDEEDEDGLQQSDRAGRRIRADAQRNIDMLLEVAKEVFVASGVDAPVREIAEKAGVGVGTLYRHFPKRSDLVAAVFRREVDACASAAIPLATRHNPDEALVRWLRHYTNFLATKRGLAAALHSGDSALDALPAYFRQHLEPALMSLLDSAVTAGVVRSDIESYDLLLAVGKRCLPTDKEGAGHGQRMVDLLIDGLRNGAAKPDPVRPRIALRWPNDPAHLPRLLAGL
jgi:AcrR family transcriptional regulator